jgi:hypothetical protein
MSIISGVISGVCSEPASVATEGTGIYIGRRMAARGTTLGVLLLAVVLVAACGDNRPTARKAIDAKFQSMDYKMATLETLAAPYGTHLERATQRYIALIRKYADQLGADEVKRRLVEKGYEVGPYCLPCQAMVDDEAKKY